MEVLSTLCLVPVHPGSKHYLKPKPALRLPDLPGVSSAKLKINTIHNITPKHFLPLQRMSNNLHMQINGTTVRMNINLERVAEALKYILTYSKPAPWC